MKKLLFQIVLTVSLLNANDFFDITLYEYIGIVAKEKNITILIDENIDKEFTLFVSTDINKNSYFEIMELLLQKHNLSMEIVNNIFYITTLKDPSRKVRPYKFNFIDIDQVKDILKMYPDIKYSYVKNMETLFLYSTDEQYTAIISMFTLVDKMPSQLKLKISIVDTDLKKIKERGVENVLNRVQSPDSNYLFNLLAFPFTINTTVNTVTSNKLTSLIKFMDTNEYSTILSSPVVTIFDNKKTLYDVVKNIPYVEGSTTVDDDQSKVTTSYSYRDVGLKIIVIPQIFKDNVLLDFDLTMENILNSSNTPTTSKRRIKQFISLKKGESFVLTGINQKETFKDVKKTPFLSDLWGIGWLFTYEKENKTDTNLTVLLEVY